MIRALLIASWFGAVAGCAHRPELLEKRPTGTLVVVVSDAETGRALDPPIVAVGSHRSGMPHEKGVVSFDRLVAGEYLVTATAFFYEAVVKSVRVRPGQRDTVRIRLPRKHERRLEF